MWNKLSMKEKAALIRVAVSNGLTDLDLIKNKYNEFADGGEETILINRDGAVPRLPENAPYVESSTKPDSFLGSDYVYNFIQKNKDHLSLGDTWNTVKDKIDYAYLNQITHGNRSVLGKTKTIYDNDDETFTSVFEVTPEHFPNRKTTTTTYYTTKDGGKEFEEYRGYLPSLGYYISTNDTPEVTVLGIPKASGGHLHNKFDEGGITATDVAKVGASFIPFVGTGLDIYDFVKEPSVENGLWALASLGADIYSAGQGSKAVRAAKLARQAQRAHLAARSRHLASAARPNNTNRLNNISQAAKQGRLAEESKQLANSHIKNYANKEVVHGLTVSGAQQAYTNKDALLDMVNNPQDYLDIKALGGPLLNQNNPIESFNGGRRLPVVRYNKGGYLSVL